ncbi:MAG: histidine kinase, partial [Bacteroidetes bacterium]|nr:histidine kinase [Bacteroidota bacterium]
MQKVWSILCFWLVLMLPSMEGIAQEQQLLSWEYFDESKGLNTTIVNDIFQDREGFLWLATREGLVRFDGHTFRYFRNVPGDSTSIYSNHVFCITEDEQGNIWTGLIRGGVSCYDRKTGKFKNYPFTQKLKMKTAPILGIFIDKEGEIWLGLGGYGLARLNPQTGEINTFDLVTPETAPHLTPEEFIYYNTAHKFWQDENGILWCTTSDDLYTFDPQTHKVTSHRFEKRASDGFYQNQAYALLPDGDFLWVGGWGSGLRKYNRKTGEWAQFLFIKNPPAPNVANTINAIAIKSENELWFSSQDKGLGIFNKKTEQFTLLQDEPDNYPGFPAGSMEKLFIDRQKNIWLNHNTQLLRVQLKDRQFHFVPVSMGETISKEYAWTSTVFEDREDRFRFTGFYSGDGLQILDKRTGKIFVPDFPSNLTEGREIRDIIQAKNGTIWILGRNYLYRFNPQTLKLELPSQPTIYSTEIGSNLYNQMTEDKAGNLWFCSSLFGLFRYNPVTGKTDHFMPDENKSGAIATHIVGSIRSDIQGRVWYASRDKTAYGYYQPNEDRFIYLDVKGEETHDLASMRVNSLYADKKGNMWVCSENGLLHFDCSGEKPRLLKKLTVNDGLTSDYVVQAVEDDKGYLWLSVPRKLLRLDHTSGQIISFGKQDGFPDLHNGIGKLNHGTFYLNGQYGYSLFFPDSLTPFRHHAPIVLSSFKVNDHEQYNGSELVLSQPFVLPANGQYFSVEFTALDLEHPEQGRYEYQLEGLNETWVQAGNRHAVNYTNVPSGHYSFRVKLEGEPDSEALVIPLVVRVAFYKTNWFWLLILAIVVGTIFLYYRNRQIQRQQVIELMGKAQLLEKEKAVVQYESLKQQLNPHFLFNSLTSLSSLITIDPRTASSFLDSLSKTYRYILKSSEWDVAPLSEELKFGESFVKLQKTRFGEGLQVNFQVEEKDYYRKIVPVTLQNLIENAIKHNILDEEEPLVINVFVEDDYLVVRNNLQKKKF